jgi:hypothetical protein
LRIERSSPFDDVAEVLEAGNTAAGNHGRDIVVQPLRCNRSQCPTTTSFTTSTTSTTNTTATTLGGPSTSTLPPSPSTTTTTVPTLPSADASWRFYVRITSGNPLPHNVDVPAHSTDAPLDVTIRADDLPAFRPGDQMSGARSRRSAATR